MKTLETELTALLEDVVLYNKKPNKSLSSRIRKQLGELKKKVTPLRATLVAADKAGY